MKFLKKISTLLVLIALFTVVINSIPDKFIEPVIADNPGAIGLNKVADIRFDNNSVTNLISSKQYSLGKNNTIVDTVYGKGLKFVTQSDNNYSESFRESFSSLGIDSQTSVLTVSFTFKAGTTSGYAGIAFGSSYNNLGIYYSAGSNRLGFRTKYQSNYSTEIPTDRDILVTAIIRKNDVYGSRLYINGNQTNLSTDPNNPEEPDDSNAIFDGYFYLKGNSCTISSVQIWDRELPEEQVNALAWAYRNTSSQEIELSVQNAEASPSNTSFVTKARSMAFAESDNNSRSYLAERVQNLSSMTSSIDTSNAGYGSIKINSSINDNSNSYINQIFKKRSSESTYAEKGAFPYSGLTGKIDFSGATAINLVNGKSYSKGTGSTTVTSPYGSAYKPNQSQIMIPTADLGISDSNTNSVTVSFWMDKRTDIESMPIAFSNYTLWMKDNSIGFNTANSDRLGISYSNNGYNHFIIVFNKTDVESSKIYLNGKLQPINIYVGESSSANAVYSSNFCISGQASGSNYRMNTSTITQINIWNRELSETEMDNVYENSIGINNGKVLDFSVQSNVARNTMTGRTYTLGTGLYSKDTAYGSGISLQGGQLQIPNNQIGISDINTSYVTLSMWVKESEDSDTMLGGFSKYSYMRASDNRVGFNTGQSDIYGNVYTKKSVWNHYTLVYNKSDLTYNKLYINGVPMSMSKLGDYPNAANVMFGNTLYLNGWGSNTNYRNTSTDIASVKVWNRELGIGEVNELYNSREQFKLLDGQQFTRDYNSSVDIGTSSWDFTQGFEISFMARWDSLDAYNRIFDFSNNKTKDIFTLYNVPNSNNLVIESGGSLTTINGIVSAGQNNLWRITVTKDGYWELYRDGSRVWYGNIPLPRTIERNYNVLGRYYSDGDPYNFKGYIGNFVIKLPTTSGKSSNTLSSRQSVMSDGTATAWTSFDYTGVGNITSTKVSSKGGPNGASFITLSGTSNQDKYDTGVIINDIKVKPNTQYKASLDYSTGYSGNMGNGLIFITGDYNNTGLASANSGNIVGDYSWKTSSVIFNTYNRDTVSFRIGRGQLASIDITNIKLEEIGSATSNEDKFISDTKGPNNDNFAAPLKGKLATTIFTQPDICDNFSYYIVKTDEYGYKTTSPTVTYNASLTGSVTYQAMLTSNNSDPIPWELYPNSTGKIDQKLSSGPWYLKFRARDGNGYWSKGKTQIINVPTINAGINVTTDIINNKIDLIYGTTDSTQTYKYNVYRKEGTGSYVKILDKVLIKTLSDTNAKDKGVPNSIANMTATETGTSVGDLANIFSWSNTDTGTSYTYYIEAIGDSDLETYVSDQISKTITTGIKEYYYVANQTSNTSPVGGTTLNSASVTLNGLQAGNTYLHLMSVDNAGNTSPILHYPFKVSSMLTASINTSSISFGAVNPLTPEITKSKAIKVTVASNALYKIDLLSQGLSSIKGNAIPAKNLLVKLNTDSSYKELSSNGVNIVSNKPYTTNAIYEIDLKLKTDFSFKPDNYTGNVTVKISQ
jgi:hypothetical protein